MNIGGDGFLKILGVKGG